MLQHQPPGARFAPERILLACELLPLRSADLLVRNSFKDDRKGALPQASLEFAGFLIIEKGLGRNPMRIINRNFGQTVLLRTLLLGVCLVASGQALALDGGSIYRQTCATCHTTGSASGAPKLGVRSDWELRLGAGRAKLLQSVMKGKGAMPPKGGNASLSDDQANAALDYMLMKINHAHDSN